MYYSTVTAQVAQLPFTCSTSSPTCSRSGLVPFSSTSRYGSSKCSSTDLHLARQQPTQIQDRCYSSRSHSRFLPARKDTGLVALSSAGTPSTCTATCPVHIPTMRGSNAPASLVDEGPPKEVLPLRIGSPEAEFTRKTYLV